jgi:hypothetical protein
VGGGEADKEVILSCPFFRSTFYHYTYISDTILFPVFSGFAVNQKRLKRFTVNAFSGYFRFSGKRKIFPVLGGVAGDEN